MAHAAFGGLARSGDMPDQTGMEPEHPVAPCPATQAMAACAMAVGEGSFNPLGYHVGTVWPHDTSIVAWGLWRYGYRKEAARLAVGILEAAELFHHRLPEALAGCARAATKYPVGYPTACSPQAWATGAPLLLLRIVLGLDPLGDHLIAAGIVVPSMPEIAPSGVEFLLVDLAAGVALAQSLESLITTIRPALRDEPAQGRRRGRRSRGPRRPAS